MAHVSCHLAVRLCHGIAKLDLLPELLLGPGQDLVVVDAEAEMLEDGPDALPPMLRLRLECKTHLLLELVVLDHRVVHEPKEANEK